MNLGSLKTSSNLHNSVILCRSPHDVYTGVFRGKGASYGAIVVCAGAIDSAPEQEYHILSGHRFPSILPSIMIALHGAHNLLGPEAQRPFSLLMFMFHCHCAFAELIWTTEVKQQTIHRQGRI